jgi:hypothetical protein
MKSPHKYMAAGAMRISRPLAKAGKAAWTVCCANMFKRMRCLKASDFNGIQRKAT